MVRLILVSLYLFLFLVLGIPVLGVMWLIGKSNPGRKDRCSKALVGWGFRCIAFLAGAKVIVLGRENIPEGAVLYVGNHRSYFDIILTYSHFPGTTGYVAKKEMLKCPLLRDWMKNIHCLFLDRENIKEGLKTILTGVEEVKNGVSLCIFPEGTRNKENGILLPFHEGSFKIAEKGGVPVVPMTIVNSAGVFEDHMPRVKPATVIIEFSPAIRLEELDRSDRKNLGSYVRNLISERHSALQEEYLS